MAAVCANAPSCEDHRERVGSRGRGGGEHEINTQRKVEDGHAIKKIRSACGKKLMMMQIVEIRGASTAS